MINKKVLKKFLAVNKSEIRYLKDRPIFTYVRLAKLFNAWYLAFTNTHYLIGFKVAELKEHDKEMCLNYKDLEDLVFVNRGSSSVLLEDILKLEAEPQGVYPDIVKVIPKNWENHDNEHTNYNSNYMKKGYDFLGTYSKEYSENMALVISEKTSSTGVKMLSNGGAFFLVTPIRK